MTAAALPGPDRRRLGLRQELQRPSPALSAALGALARLAARLCECPIGFVGLGTQHLQWIALDSDAPVDAPPAAQPLLQQALAGATLFELEDAAPDAALRCFAGMPLQLEGQVVGVIGAADHGPRRLDARMRAGLGELAVAACALLAQRDSQARLQAVLRAVPDLWFVVGADDRYLQCSDEQHPWLAEPFARMRGRLFGEMLGAELRERSHAALHRACLLYTSPSPRD